MIQDLTYAVRTLRRAPSFAIVVVLTLAVGIGANTAIFTAVNALLLRKPAVAAPDRLVTFAYSDDEGAAALISSAAFAGYRDRLDVFSDVAASSIVRRASASGPLDVAMVSGGYFATIGVNAALGRTLTADDDRDGHSVILISHAIWRRVYDAAPDVIGRSLSLLGVSYTVVGVLPEDFRGEWIGRSADVWVPMAMQPAIMPEKPDLLTSRGPAWLNVVARLRPSVTERQASDAINALFASTRELPVPSATMTPERIAEVARVRLGVEAVGRVSSPDRVRLGSPLTLLMAAVTIVLLIACANVSNLMLARATTREREFALRVALGAGRWRLLRQLLAESALLCIAGTAGALLFAAWAADGLLVVLSDPRAPLAVDVRPDLHVVAFAAAWCAVTTAAFGLVPVLRVRRLALRSSFSTHGRGAATPRQRLAINGLMVVQVAFSAVLLVGAGLFARTLYHLRTDDPGFSKSELVLAWFDPAQAGYSASRALTLYDEIAPRLAALPGVVSASVSNRGLFAGLDSASPVVVPGYAPRSDDDYWVRWNIVGDDFLRTSGTPILRGRAPGRSDIVSSPRVAAVNEAFARKYFGTTDVLGRRFSMRRAEAPPLEIVGVVANARYETLREARQPMIFLPYRQDPAHLGGPLCVLIRTTSPIDGIAASIRQAVRAIDPGLPLSSIQTASEQIEATLVGERVTASMSGLFAGLAAILVVIGLYGLLAYSVECRTNEIGIRGALGATPGDVIRMVLRESGVLVMLGLAIGLPLARAGSTAIASRLYEVAPGDPAIFAAAATLLLLAAAGAATIPAARAGRIDPMEALRRE